MDLAGSERISQTNTSGARLKEGSHINRSLLTLTTVIRKLRSVAHFCTMSQCTWKLELHVMLPFWKLLQKNVLIFDFLSNQDRKQVLVKT